MITEAQLEELEQIEQLAIQRFQDTGWNYVHGAVIAPEGVAAEREDRGNIEHRTPNIEHRSEEKKSLAEAVRRLNPKQEPSSLPSPMRRRRKMAVEEVVA